MSTSVFDLLPELVEVVVFGVGSLLLSAAGIYLEETAISMLLSGQSILGAWMMGMGMLVMTGAYLAVRDNLVPTVADIRHHARDSPGE